MKISFDLDDTLIPANSDCFKTELRSFIQKLLGVELLRTGTGQLFRKLQSDGHTVGVYTTSFRSKLRVYFQFWTYGIKPHFIINEQQYQKIRKQLRSQKIYSSKYPPSFQIDIHIDDSEGVRIEGEKYKFKTIIIQQSDEKWVDKISTFIESLNA